MGHVLSCQTDERTTVMFFFNTFLSFMSAIILASAFSSFFSGGGFDVPFTGKCLAAF